MSTGYVDGAVKKSGDGKSWGTAMKILQEATKAAKDGGIIKLAQGTSSALKVPSQITVVGDSR